MSFVMIQIIHSLPVAACLMITKLKYRGFHVCCKNNDSRYLDILDDILSCNVKKLHVEKVFKCQRHTHVSLLNTPYGQFVLKVYSPQKKRLEKFAKSLFRPNDNENLIKKIDLAQTQGHTFPNDFYLLAERRTLKFARLSIMLFEYIPGPELRHLPAIPQAVIHDVKTAMQQMHEMKIISGDAHEGNFILSDNGVRIIDLSGKRCNAKRKIEDSITANIRMGIPFEAKNLREKFLRARKTKRHFKIKERTHRLHLDSLINHQNGH
ncbi:lipopolysaccharide core heptose(II) kinase RfaY [Scandinavium manionii]|uniref:lipopolysaccharide core heptose(II) kinase RfaY n=1 Tax=Scandinavium manionii TaxID=2926520 RepID=UPI0021659FAB|nr:lipopolysaccharide core heptose(II) kinase RfaY [Scandinavium manionii]MCS2167183.1 lipopolysaccharide core heptose(II) kinase RfaY [Scandinavium manionii]